MNDYIHTLRVKDEDYYISLNKNMVTSGLTIAQDGKLSGGELLGRIQGRSENTNSREDSFKYLGRFNDYEELNLVLDNLIWDIATIGGNVGYFRANVGDRDIDIKNILMSSTNRHSFQVVSGLIRIDKLTVKKGGENVEIIGLVNSDYIYKTVCRSNYPNSEWGEWKEVYLPTLKTINDIPLIGEGNIEITNEGAIDLSGYVTQDSLNSNLENFLLSYIGNGLEYKNKNISVKGNSGITVNDDGISLNISSGLTLTNENNIIVSEPFIRLDDIKIDKSDDGKPLSHMIAYETFNEKLSGYKYNDKGYYRIKVGGYDTELTIIGISSSWGTCCQVIKGMININPETKNLYLHFTNPYKIFSRTNHHDGDSGNTEWNDWQELGSINNNNIDLSNYYTKEESDEKYRANFDIGNGLILFDGELKVSLNDDIEYSNGNTIGKICVDEKGYLYVKDNNLPPNSTESPKV